MVPSYSQQHIQPYTSGGSASPIVRTHGGINLDGYSMPSATDPRMNMILQGSQGGAGDMQMNIPRYGNYGMQMPPEAQHMQSLNAHMDGASNVPSPGQQGAFAYRHRGSVSGLSDGQNPSSPSQGHRLSIGSGTPFSRQRGNGSIDGSDPSSPQSGRPRLGSGDAVSTEEMNASAMSAHGGSQMKDEDGQQQKPRDGETDNRPAWAELKTKAGKERKRLPLACIACRRKKIRCSGEKPACQHCLRSRIPCVYKVTTRKAAPRTDYMAMLDKRLKRMEERVIKIIPKEEQGDVVANGRAVVKPAIPGIPPKTPGPKKRQAEEAFGNDLDEWARTKSTTTRAPSRQGRPQDGAEDKLLTEGADSLPSKELQQHLAEVYFEYVYGQSYQLLHKPSFMRKLSAGEVPPVLTLSVCAISARFSNHPQVRTEPAFLRGEQWAAPAREIALKRYDSPNLTILIVYLLLGLHEFGTCQGGRSWMFGGMAQRMAYALQLHRDLEHDPVGRGKGDRIALSFTDREIRRRVMWACFMMDRFNSSGTERPLFVNEMYIKVQLPVQEHYFQMEIPAPTQYLDEKDDIEKPSPTGSADSGQLTDRSANMGVAAYVVRVVALFGRVTKYFNLGGREDETCPMWAEESGYNVLRREAEAFRQNLPSFMQYNQANLENHATKKIANSFLFLHIAYNGVVLAMNRFAAPNVRPPKDVPSTFFITARQAAIEAANQVSMLMNDALDYRVVAPFAGYCAFSAASIHIHGAFSKEPQLEAKSKQYLANNVKYISKMKKHWGMFHFLAEHLKEMYRQCADAAMRGLITPSGSRAGPQGPIFQYGDWYDRYPHGVSKTDYEDPAAEIKKEPGTDAVLGHKSDLQSVEEFFAGLSPPSRAEQQRKMAKNKTNAKTGVKHEKQAAGPQADGVVTNGQQAPGLADAHMVQQHQLQQQLHQQQQHQHQQQQMVQGQSQQRSQQQHPNHLQLPPNPLTQQAYQQQMYNMSQQRYNQLPQNRQQQQQQPQQDVDSYPPDLSMLHSQPGMLSQLDRHLVLSSYTGVDPSSHLWDMDFSGMAANVNGGGNQPVGGGNGGGGGFYNDSGIAWLLPFNLDPPDVGMENADGIDGSGGMFGAGGGFGFEGLSGLDELGTLGQGQMDGKVEAGGVDGQ